MVITQAELKRRLHYDPDTGNFTWTNSGNRSIPSGHFAGGVWPTRETGSYYHFIRINCQTHRAHTLACIYMTGNPPPKDRRKPHYNGDTLDNRWENLKDAYGRQ